MKQTTMAIHSALAGILALGLGVTTGNAAQAGAQATEKCAGIVKAGRNDCATSVTACHGSVTVDAHPEAWIYVPQGTCDRIVGGRVTAQQTPEEQAASGRSTQRISGRRPPYRRS